MKKMFALIALLALGGDSLSLAETGVYLAAKGSKVPPEIKKGLARLLAADTDHAVREMLAVGLQFHTTSFDHPTDGIVVPSGFNWDWVMTVPHEVADAHRRAWIDAGYKWSVSPSVQLAADKVRDRGWPTGWLRAVDGIRGQTAREEKEL